MRASLWILTVGRGRVSVSVISPQEHVQGEVGDMVTLLMDGREKHESNWQHRGSVKHSSHGDTAQREMAVLILTWELHEILSPWRHENKKRICTRGNCRWKNNILDDEERDEFRLLYGRNVCSTYTNLHSWGSRTGRQLWGTMGHWQPQTLSLVAWTTAADRRGHQTAWKEPACVINIDGSRDYSARGWIVAEFKVKSVKHVAPPTMAWVCRFESSHCGSPDSRSAGLSQHPRPDSQIKSWRRRRPPSVNKHHFFK